MGSISRTFSGESETTIGVIFSLGWRNPSQLWFQNQRSRGQRATTLRVTRTNSRLIPAHAHLEERQSLTEQLSPHPSADECVCWCEPERPANQMRWRGQIPLIGCYFAPIWLFCSLFFLRVNVTATRLRVVEVVVTVGQYTTKSKNLIPLMP